MRIFEEQYKNADSRKVAALASEAALASAAIIYNFNE